MVNSCNKKIMNERDSVLKRARRSGSEMDWDTYRRLQNQVSNRIKIEKQRYNRTEIQYNMDNPKTFRRTMKNIFPNKTEKTTTPQSIKTDNGKIVADKLAIAQICLTCYLHRAQCVWTPGRC